MKIAMISGNGGSAGLIRYVKGLLLAFNDSNVNIQFYCTQEFSDKLDDYSTNISIVPTSKLNESGKAILLEHRLHEEIITKINEYAPDVILYTNGYCRKGLERYPNVMILHNQLFVNDRQLFRQGLTTQTLKLFLFRCKVRKDMKRVDGIIFLSQQSQKEALEKISIKAKTSVIRFGLNTSEYAKDVHYKPISSKIKLIYISAFYPYKNQLELIDGLYLLRRKNIDFELHFIGRAADSKYMARVKKKIKNYGLDSCIIFHGWVEHEKTKEMIDQSDIYLYASSIETTGLGVMEGMARGAAIACSDQNIHKEILEEGGCYFDPFSAESIFNSISKLINNDTMRFTMQRRAYDRAKHFSWENASIETERFLRSFK